MKWFHDMKIAAKLMLSFGLVSVAALIVGVVGYRGLATDRVLLSEIADHRLPSMRSILLIQMAQKEVNSAENALLAAYLSRRQRTRLGGSMSRCRRPRKKRSIGCSLCLPGRGGGRTTRS